MEDVTRRLAHKIWELFEKEELQNTSEGNWNAAKVIVDRILNGTYKVEEFRKMLGDDYEHVKRVADENTSRFKEDCCGN